MKNQISQIKLGHLQIDQQHAELLRQIKELSNLVLKRTEDATIIKLLDLLIIKSIEHYNTEEDIMNTLTNYSDKDAHIYEHHLVIQNMTQFKHKLQHEIIEYQINFNTAVKMWLEHIFKYDQSLIEDFNKKVIDNEK